ncbi:MAG: class I SAM-dependent methyltransferase [Myxococcota bacterium]
MSAASGNVVGNHYDKYGTKNPIARALMRGFMDGATSLYRHAAATSVLEVGCGEGHLAQALLASAPAPDRFEITDVDIRQVPDDLPLPLTARRADVYALPYPDDAFDLVVCCEVLEHLDDPAAGLKEVARVAKHHVLLSTPWEPVWRAMNMARGKYLLDLGNTPGHVQHFSRRGLERLASSQLSILQRRTPLPWTMLLGAPRR